MTSYEVLDDSASFMAAFLSNLNLMKCYFNYSKIVTYSCSLIIAVCLVE